MTQGRHIQTWLKYLHHITLHASLMAPFFMAALGLWMMHNEDEHNEDEHNEDEHMQRFLRTAGWCIAAWTTIVVITGLATAPGWFGGQGSVELTHHRDLGLVAWAVILLAASTYSHGVRGKDRDFRLYGVAMWCVASFAVAGAGHWGASTHRPDLVPWSSGADLRSLK